MNRYTKIVKALVVLFYLSAAVFLFLSLPLVYFWWENDVPFVIVASPIMHAWSSATVCAAAAFIINMLINEKEDSKQDADHV